MIQKVVVLGGGTMGNGIAHTFAQYGFKVSLVDITHKMLEEAKKNIESNLDRMIYKGNLTPEDKLKTLNQITFHESLEHVVPDAEFIIEAATENMEIKLNIFRQLDQLSGPGVVLASNTSSISISKIASVTRRPADVVGMHFMNPVPLMKLVEIIKGYNTGLSAIETVKQLCSKLEKIPVEVSDYPGFVANRILMPMINEAIYSLYEGVAGIKEIDTVMKLGMAHPMGPLQLADFIGLDVCLSILTIMYEGFRNPKYAPCPLLINMVTSGNLGCKSGEGFYDYTETKKAEQISKRFIR